MPKPKTVRFTEEWLSKLPPAPEEGELVTCPSCLGQHPLIYEDENPTPNSWGYVECGWECVLAVVEGRVIGGTPLQIEEETIYERPVPSNIGRFRLAKLALPACPG